ncbi:hypothetical protein C8D77_1127 [Mesorhizobium loti]|uniref:Uncharacterized protein n=2 Tax=Rhizobium loti TaxID=381 RepID=A0A8E2WA57_RHILI|nr:hypothetical protein C8D77_1127 [Mesorhizobium loti]
MWTPRKPPPRGEYAHLSSAFELGMPNLRLRQLLGEVRNAPPRGQRCDGFCFVRLIEAKEAEKPMARRGPYKKRT